MAKKRGRRRGLLVLIVAGAGLLLGLFLIRYESDLRSSAKEVAGCKVCKKGKCVKNDRKCSSQANECSVSADCSTAKKTTQMQTIYKYTCNPSTGQCTASLSGDHDSRSDCEAVCSKSRKKSSAIAKNTCPTSETLKTRSCVKVNTIGATYCPGLIRPYCCPVGQVFSHDGFSDAGRVDKHKYCCDKNRLYNETYCCSRDLVNGKCPGEIPVVVPCEEEWCDINKPDDTECCDGYSCVDYKCTKQ